MPALPRTCRSNDASFAGVIKSLWIQTIKLKFLRESLIFRQRHADDILREFAEYYSRVRSHTEWEYLPLNHSLPDEVQSFDSNQIVVKTYVGGLVKSFEGKAA